MGQENSVGGVKQPRVDLGLTFVDVEPGSEDGAGVQCLGQRLLVHHRAAGRVHEHSVGTHELELAGADQMAAVLVQRDMEAHDVGLFE